MNLKELVSPERRERGLWWQRAWSLVEGCTPVSEACEHCWSAAQAHMRAHQKNPKMVRRYAGLTTKSGNWSGKIRLLEDNLELPKTVKEPALWEVWNDLFHPDVPADFIYKVLEVITECPQHFFLVLTKRIVEAHSFIRNCEDYDCRDFPNLGWGTTVELPKYYLRIKYLLSIPAALHFLSLEPLLGEFDVGDLEHFLSYYCCAGIDCECRGQMAEGVKWVILGCESGKQRRQTKWEWVDSIMMKCINRAVPVFIKQMEYKGQLIKGSQIFRNSGRPMTLQFPFVDWSCYP